MNTNKPLVSILVNCYNSQLFLKQALDSVYQQTYQNFEIILVDNCSTDKTAEIAKSYDHRLKYVKTEKNIPLYGARNVGLPHISGQYFCILDSDDYWVSNKLELQLKTMNEYSDVDIIYTSYFSHYETCQPNTKLNWLRKAYLKVINFSDNCLSNQIVPKEAIIKNYNINFQTIMFKSAVVQNINFDDRMNLMGDLDFIYRLVWIKQAKLYFLNSVTAYSRIHERQLSRRSDLKWVGESLKVLHKISTFMTDDEKAQFNRFFIRFYYSSYLLRVKKYPKALMMKMSYAFVSLRFCLHFIKSFLFVLKGKYV